MKRQSLQTLVLASGLAISTVGCNTLDSIGRAVSEPFEGKRYDTNAASNLKQTQFSDKYFSVRRSEVALPTGHYVFGKINQTDSVTVNGVEVPYENLFPFWAVRTNEMTEHVFPATKEVKYGRNDGKVRVFVKDNIQYIATNQRGVSPQMPKDKRVATLDEIEFKIPGVNFGIPGFELVNYTGFANKGEEAKLVFMQNASYRFDKARGNCADFFADGFYVESIGQIKARPEGLFTVDDILNGIHPVYQEQK